METFKKVSLLAAKDGSDFKPSSLPLVLPNNLKYDPATDKVTRSLSVTRTRLEIVPSTVQFLSQIREPVAVLSIAGMARSGKSYLLSRILRSSDAFSLGHSMEPETFGIWIGTQVLKNKDFTVVLVDTEGIDAASAEKENDISLLVLTILLSSYFVFNTISVPKQAQLEDLECFVQLVQGLRVNREGGEDYNNFPAVFPDFLWLLRDVSLTPTDEKGKEIDARTYLTERLLKPSGGGFEEKPSDKVARAIKTFFPSIDCVTLPVPSEDADVMRHVESRESELSTKFNEGIQAVVSHILARLRPKTGYKTDTHVTGSQLACMLQTYVNAVNEPGAIPVVETSWETSLRILAERFYQEAVEIYKKGMTAGLDACGEEPMEADGDGGQTLLSLHRKYYNMAKENVAKGLGPLCNEVEQGKSLGRLQEVVFGSKGRKANVTQAAGLFHGFWRMNYEKSLSYCQRLSEKLYELIAKKIAKNDKGYTFDKLKEDLKEFEVQYRAKSKGPAVEKVYEDFMEFIKSEEKTFAKVDDFKREEFAEQQRAAKISTKIGQMVEEQRHMETVMMEEMEENKKQAEKLSNEYSEKVDKMKEVERKAYVQRMGEQTEKMQENMRESMKMMKDVADKNNEFMEKSLKMAQEQRKEQQQQMVEMVEAFQEKNAQIAKELAEQAAKQSKSPLEQIGNFITSISSLANIFGVLQSKFPKRGQK